MSSDDALRDEVVHAAAAGSRPDLDHLAAAMLPRIRTMIVARLGMPEASRHVVDDLTQSAMLALTTGISRLERQTVIGVRSYASGIVGNLVAAHLKGKRQTRAVRDAVSLETPVLGDSENLLLWQIISSGDTSPSTTAARDEACSRLLSELFKLRDEDRDVITLAFLDQLPTSEIAKRLKISRAAASMRLLRALKTLRQAVSGAGKPNNSA